MLELLPSRTLFDLRLRERLFALAAATSAVGRVDEGRDQLSTLARLAALSLEVGESTHEVRTLLRWPSDLPVLSTRGPGDPLGASDWLLAYSAALVADDAETELHLLARRGQLRDAKGVSIDSYWAPLADAWAAVAAEDVTAAGEHLARALELAHPEASGMSPGYVLAVPVPAIEVTFCALERDQHGFDAAIDKGLERARTELGDDSELALLPLYLLAAVRLGLRRGLRIERVGFPLDVISP